MFHEQCDSYDVTVTVARNSLGYTFGGYAAVSWSLDAFDSTGASNFIFALDPGTATRFGPTGFDTSYQDAGPTDWPMWGRNGGDLNMGGNGPPGYQGHGRFQGTTYAGTPNEICGGDGNWGQTDLEVWRLAWLQRWDSGGATNGNGRTFTLYLLPAQPANTFS